MLFVKRCPQNDCPEESWGLLHRHRSGLLHCGKCGRKWEDPKPPLESARRQLYEIGICGKEDADGDPDADA